MHNVFFQADTDINMVLHFKTDTDNRYVYINFYI